MNPAFDRTLSLLVESGDEHSPPRSTSSEHQPPRTTAALREPKRTENRTIKSKIFGGAKPSYNLSTDDTPADQYIPPPLNKAETFYDKLKAALINSKEKFKAGVRKVSAKIKRKKDSN